MILTSYTCKREYALSVLSLVKMPPHPSPPYTYMRFRFREKEGERESYGERSEWVSAERLFTLAHPQWLLWEHFLKLVLLLSLLPLPSLLSRSSIIFPSFHASPSLFFAQCPSFTESLSPFLSLRAPLSLFRWFSVCSVLSCHGD